MNDLHKAFINLNITHFADDTNLFFHVTKSGTIEFIVNLELKHLVDWFQANKLSLNESKSKLVLFCSKKSWINT